MKEFFGLSKLADGGYGFLRKAEGAWSWQHLTFVSLLMLFMVVLAFIFGRKYKGQSLSQANRVLMVCAF